MIRVTTDAVQAPGHCAITRSTTGPFVETDVTIPRYGRIYLSVPWLLSIAPEVGLVPSSTLTAATDARKAAQDEVEMLRNRVERFDEEVVSIGEAIVAFAGEFTARQDLAAELEAARDEVRDLNARIDQIEGE